MTVRIAVVDMDAPDDTAGIAAALAKLGAGRLRRLAVLVKVEGNAAANDFSRELARRAIGETLAAWGGDPGAPASSVSAMR